MKKSIIVGFVILFLVIIGLGAFLGIILYSFYDNQVDIVEKSEVIEEEKIDVVLPEVEEVEEEENLIKDDLIYKEEQKKDEIINILLLGMDARPNETRSRSDTILLLSYNKTTHTIKMVSFLRDTWVYLPERGWSKINAATAYGGVGLLINTLNENFDLDVQNYVQIKFNDFKKVIDILGGIDIELTASEIKYINNKLHVDDEDWSNDIIANPGIVHLNGTQTLWHCRNRSIGNGDFSRTDRQRIVVSLLINKAMDMNLSQLTQLIYEMKDYVDMNVPMNVLLDIAQDALIHGDLTIESYHIPFDNLFNYANKNGASVIEIDIDKTVEELHLILGLDAEIEGEIEHEVD